MLEPNERVDQYISVDGIYERRFLKFFRRVLPKNSVMIDIGANIGNHALFLYDVCSQVHCFEPNPRAADRLANNIELNHATNVYVHRMGLGDRDGHLPFSVNVVGNLGNSGFFRATHGDHGKFNVIELPIRVASDAIADLALERIDLIKMDVEGLEEEIFRGLKETIAEFRPLIAFEYHAQSTPPSSFARIRDDLPDYVIADLAFAPDGSGAWTRLMYHLRHGDSLTLRAVESPSHRTYESLLAIPLEHELAAQVVA